MDNVKQMAFYQMCCKLGIMLPYSVKDLLMYGGIRGGIFQNPLCLRIPFNAALLIDQEVQSSVHGLVLGGFSQNQMKIQSRAGRTVSKGNGAFVLVQ